jgi:hypothetical protein
MNRAFVGTIWGLQELLKSETYHTMPIFSVRTDPLLSRAASLWGGIPQLNLQDVSGILPEDIREYLLQKVTS